MKEPLKQRMIQLETELLQSDVRESPGRLSLILADDFLEIGHTGKVLTKSGVLESLSNLAKSSHEAYIPSEWQIHELSQDVFLVTYLLQRENPAKPATRRSSIWKHQNNHWQLLYHQGTIIVSAE